MRAARPAALCAAVLLLGCARPAASQACDLATLFAHLSEIQDSCCSDNECSSGYPGVEDACGRQCGEIFEPFWDSCGAMLAAMGVGGTEGMVGFYDTCLAVRLPPPDFRPRIPLPSLTPRPLPVAHRRSTRRARAPRTAHRA